MDIYIAKPAEIEYNDSDYSVYESNTVSYTGCSRDEALEILRTAAAITASNWNHDQVEGATSPQHLEDMLIERSTLDCVTVDGVATFRDLDTWQGERVVWIVARDVNDYDLYGEVLDGFRDAQTAAEHAREHADLGSMHMAWFDIPRAVPVPVRQPTKDGP